MTQEGAAKEGPSGTAPQDENGNNLDVTIALDGEDKANIPEFTIVPEAEIPSNLKGISEGGLAELMEKAKRELAAVELELLEDFCNEDAKQKAKDKKETETAPGKQNEKPGDKEQCGDVASKENAPFQDNRAEGPTNKKVEEDPKKGQTEEVSDKNKKNDDKAKKKDGEDDLIWRPPPLSVPIRADVRNFDFEKLASMQKRATGKKFDVIMTDPPWQLATSNPTRGVAIGYQQLSDSLITNIPFPKLQDNGLIFVWVINAKYKFALDLLEKWGYTLVDEITWVKRTVNRRLAKSHGFYLQHAKETCLVGRKGDDPEGLVGNIASDIIYSERRGQSQKPVEIYEIIEQLVPNGSYLEVFARRNNLRDGWCSVGNEL